MSASRLVHRLPLPWRDPLEVASGLGDRPDLLALISDGGDHGRLSWVAAEADELHMGPVDPADAFAQLRLEGWDRGVACLASYDLGARPATGFRDSGWPDLILARYASLLRFDHVERRVEAIGLGSEEASAEVSARRAARWLDAARALAVPPPPAIRFEAEAPDERYRAAVSDVVQRIAAGELFQANIARAWTGELKPGAEPLQLLLRLAQGRAAAYGAYWRMGDRALVSNSPELFLTLDPARRHIETRPIKGTRPRHPDPAEDRTLAASLQAAAKDRAENLMIVDLMRNDLARVAEPGSVKVDRLFELETHPTVHHLVSTVTAILANDRGAADLLQAAFPPGSITGAPKHQAMKVIAAHEPPRGPWCGAMIWLDDRGAMASSVLIRTASFIHAGSGWTFRTLAGAGIVADSEPEAELEETEAKIEALRAGLIGGP